MNEENKNTEKPNFTLLYVAIGCFAVACVLFVLAFVINGAGVYLLISSMITTLAAMSFINGQKRKATNTLCKIMQVLNYVIMIAAVGVFVWGTVAVNS